MNKNKDKKIPIQYVEGQAPFYGYEFFVNKNVLIPRFETEELVENTIKLINEHFNNKPIKVLDLCTGSGCIGITIKKKLPRLDITLSDISKEALNVAGQNAKELNAEVNIIKSDMLKNVDTKFDIITCNPPYIKTDEFVEPIVKDNEPHLALYAGKDGLKYYKEILDNIKENLNDKSFIALEIGETQGEDIKNIAIKKGFTNIIIKKDMQNRDRFIFILNNLK